MILFDLTTFCRPITGVHLMWAEYLRRVPHSMPTGLDLVAFLPESHNLPVDSRDWSALQVRPTTARGRYLKYVPSLIRGSGSDVLHMGHYQTYPLFHGKRVVTVHDFVYERYFPWRQRLAHGLLQSRAIVQADAIHCVSETTKADLIERFPGMQDRDIRVIPNAAGAGFYPDPSSPPEYASSYLLWVGKRAGYKNFDGALVGLHRLKQAGQTARLVVVGAPLTYSERRRISALGLTEWIEVREGVDQAGLRRMYSDAKALVYLTRHEGFGLPILEAQQCGCPVICLRAPGCEEVGKDAALYLDEQDPDGLQDLIDAVSDPERRRRVVEAGLANARRYDWDSSAAELARLYTELAGV
jgi:mannosyltransferase